MIYILFNLLCRYHHEWTWPFFPDEREFNSFLISLTVHEKHFIQWWHQFWLRNVSSQSFIVYRCTLKVINCNCVNHKLEAIKMFARIFNFILEWPYKQLFYTNWRKQTLYNFRIILKKYILQTLKRHTSRFYRVNSRKEQQLHT